MTKLIKSPVVFEETDHSYMLGDKRLSGITGLIHSILGLGVYPDADPYVQDHVIPRAGSRGTAIHHAIQSYDMLGMKITEQIVNTKYGCRERDNEYWQEEKWDVSNELDAYIRHLEEYRFRPLANEYTVSDNKRYASQIDNVLEYVETGGIWLGDTKSNNISLYPLCGYFNPHYFSNGKEALKEYLSWQLSIYAELFELQNPVLKVEGLCCNWLRKDDDAFWIIERKPSELVWELLKTECIYIGDKFCYFHSDLSVFGIKIANPFDDSVPIPAHEAENTPILKPDVVAYMADLLREQKDAEERLQKAREGLRKAMEEHKVKSVDFGQFSATIGSDSVTTSFDSKRFKADHPELYNQYSTKKSKKGSLTIKLKENDKIQS